MSADRYNKGKPKWGLVHWPSLEPMVRVLMFGVEKYAKDNWKKGLDRVEILESAQRHLIALFNGEEDDSESKVSHAGHVMCNMMFYIFFTKKENNAK